MKKLLCFFILLVVPHAVYALSHTTCDDCYKCVAYSGSNCVKCEYDANYCNDFILCESPKEAVNGQCVCPNMCMYPYEQDPDTCECFLMPVACSEGEVWNEETAACEKIKCKSGWYHDGSGCAACPGNTSTGDGVYDGGVSAIECGYQSSNYGANGITDCYQVAARLGIRFCTYSDDSGMYQLTEDCKYNNRLIIVDPIN